MFAPMYHDSADGNSVEYATSLTCSAQSACARCVASTASAPRESAYPIRSRMNSTCCSMDSTMLLSTDGLPGPVTRNMFGNPATATPRYECGPAAHASRSDTPPGPMTEILVTAPVTASNPVANTSASSSYDAAAVRSPPGYADVTVLSRPTGPDRPPGDERTSTSVTSGRLNIAK
jgi:hypothetical protein